MTIKFAAIGLTHNHIYGQVDCLLREGATLAKASSMTGYASEASFSHAFRQWSGLAPGAWRRKLERGASLQAGASAANDGAVDGGSARPRVRAPRARRAVA